MKNWLKDYAPVIGALTGLVLAIVAVLHLVIVRPMNARFDDMNSRFDDMIGSVNDRFDDVNNRFGDLIGSVNDRFDDVNNRFDDMNNRFDDLGAQMNQRFDQQDKYMNARFDAVDQRFDILSGEVSELRQLTVSITERVSRNEGQIDLITERLQPAPAPAP